MVKTTLAILPTRHRLSRSRSSERIREQSSGLRQVDSLIGTVPGVFDRFNGIVAENAIFIIHELMARKQRGMDTEQALIEAIEHRARPVIITTLAAVLAFLPLALGLGAGAQMQQPLAIAVIGGFSISSLLLFFGLPVVYRLFESTRPAKDSGNIVAGVVLLASSSRRA